MKTSLASAFLLALLPVLFVQAQSSTTPKVSMVITRVDKVTAAAGVELSISGRGFPSDEDDVVVFFGGTGVSESGPITAEPFLLRVKVPVGATYDNITVLNADTGETASSSQIFGLNFSGSGPLTPTSLETAKSFAVDYAISDMALCDFNSDGKLDIALSHRSITTGDGKDVDYVTVMVNNVDNANIGQVLQDNAFTKNVTLKFRTHTSHITCADIDGNGKPDLIASEAKKQGDLGTAGLVYVALNTTPSTPSAPLSFVHAASNKHQFFRLPDTNRTAQGSSEKIQRESSVVVAKDVDGDGRPDIVVNNATDEAVFIYRNTTTGTGPTGYELADQFKVPLPTTCEKDCANPDPTKRQKKPVQAMEIKDLNADGKPELIVAESGSNKCFVLINNSSPGKISFEEVAITREVEGAFFQYVSVGDLNNDEKPDLVFSSGVSSIDANSDLFVFENTTKEGGKPEISDTPLRISVREGNMQGIHIGDLDGDGWQDIAMSFHHDDGHNGGDGKKVFVLRNKAEADMIGLERVDMGQVFSAVRTKIADLNRDGRPDLIFAHQTKAKDGAMGVLINKHCLNKPTLDPSDNNLVACAGAGSFEIEALPPTEGGWVSYQWESKTATTDFAPAPATAPATSTSRKYNLRDAALPDGNYTIRAKMSIGTCEVFSDEVMVEKKANTVTEPMLAPTPRELCEGTASPLPAPMVGSARVPTGATHTWRGPNNYKSTDETPNIANPTTDHAGEYVYFYTNAAGCRSPEARAVMSVKSVPRVTIGVKNDESPYVCEGATISKALEVRSEEDLTTGVTYAWKKGKTALDPAVTDPAYTATESGKYTVNITKDGCSKDAPEIDIRALKKPVVDFLIGGADDLKQITCTDVTIPFIPNEVSNPNKGVDNVSFSYEWNFGDDSEKATKENVSHTYGAKGEYGAALKVGYRTGTGEAMEVVDMCETTKTKVVTIVDPPAFPVVRNPDVSEKCPLDEISLSAPSTVDIGGEQREINSYTWSTGGTDRVIVVKKPGEYSVRIENVSTGCTSSASTQIMNKNNSGVSISVDPNFVDKKDEDKDILHLKPLAERTRVVLTIENVQNQDQNSVLGWSRTVGLNRKDQIKPVLTAYYDPEVSSPYTYTVTAVDNSGCEDTANLSLPILPDPLPQGDRLFSPNGDGVGDRWKLLKIDLNDKKCDLSIYDRRGKLLFQEKQVAKEWLGWNGTVEGRELEQDVYYYVVECACEGQTNCPRRNSGSILLFR